MELVVERVVLVEVDEDVVDGVVEVVVELVVDEVELVVLVIDDVLEVVGVDPMTSPVIVHQIYTILRL